MGRKGPRRDVGKERMWRGALKRWGRSGKTVREFCREEKLSEPSFYAWRRELARRSGAGRSVGEQPAAPLFLPVRVAEGTGGSGVALEIRLPSGHVLRGTEPEKLARLAALLGGPAC